MKNRITLACCLFIAYTKLMAQVDEDTVKTLPFAIADEKKLSEEDLAHKKEGTYITGVPELSSDPVNGFGYGAEGSLFFNGKRSDPFFNYTPYRKRLDIVLFNTTKNQRELFLKLDIPYIFNSKWRLRVEGGYEVNPNLLYFGTTEKSLQSLRYYPGGDSTQTPVTAADYTAYDNALQGQDDNYNRYTKEEFILNISAEHSFMDSKLRVLGGYELAHVNITPFAGNSRIGQDFQNGQITGVGKGLVAILQVGIVYDTRDLEPDPSKGIFAELTNELSLQALGSKYNFNKTFIQAKFYQPVLPRIFRKFIFASRIGIGYTAGDSPFFEYQDQWGSEGSIEGLGGAHTLRGYKQSRFLGRVMNFANAELRFRFIQFNIFKQHIGLSAVPFFDIGGVWDSLYRLGKWDNYRYDEGCGLRVAWNVSTILRFDYAVSKEDGQFFFNLGHVF